MTAKPTIESESCKPRPLCPRCNGRNSRWSPTNEDDPRESPYCFTCERVIVYEVAK